MKIELQDIEQGPQPIEETLEIAPATEGDPSGFGDKDSLVRVGPVKCRGELSFVDPGYLLRSDLEYERTLLCDRCLDEFSDPVQDELTLVIVRRAGDAREIRDLDSEVELEEDDLDISVVDGDVLDTEPLVRENVLLNVPMKPLCSPDCEGLCPECGQKKADGCDCSEPVDDRWKALAALRDQLPS